MIHRRLIFGLAVVAVVVLGCAGSPAVGTTAGPSSSAVVTITVPPTEAAATTDATPSVPATAGASADPSDELPASPNGSGPPQATLRVEGGDPVTGQLGTYTWGDAGSDSPWLRGAPLKAAAGEPLTMTLRDGVAIARWTARRVPAGSEGGQGATSLGMGPAGPVTFESPKKGNWSVQVTVEFGGDQGSASYYWQLDVK